MGEPVSGVQPFELLQMYKESSLTDSGYYKYSMDALETISQQLAEITALLKAKD